MVSGQSISTCNLIRKFNLGTKHAALEEVPPIECGLLNRINVKFQRCISPASKKIKKDSRISGFNSCCLYWVWILNVFLLSV